jgi:ATP phosphoribosyltransferase regulatory subunit
MFVALQNKDDSTLQQLTSGLEVSLRDSMLQLPHLYGSRKILSEARRVLPDWGEIRVALDELEHISEPLAKDVDNLCFDLSDLRGYRYHNGMVFTAYTLGRTTAIAQGGRYDGAGQAFGRARAATGFSMDLRELIKSRPPQADTRAILAPYGEDPALHHKITALRSQGEIVIVELPGTEEARSELHCDRILVLQNGAWVVSTL